MSDKHLKHFIVRFSQKQSEKGGWTKDEMRISNDTILHPALQGNSDEEENNLLVEVVGAEQPTASDLVRQPTTTVLINETFK